MYINCSFTLKSCYKYNSETSTLVVNGASTLEWGRLLAEYLSTHPILKRSKNQLRYTSGQWQMQNDTAVTTPSTLTLCQAQRLKTSARVHGQNVPKRPFAIGKLCCFQTRKFPYNLARSSWIITVRDFRYFLPRHLHCLCVRSESERVF